MIDIRSLEVLKTLLTEGLALDTPRVEPVVPVIRSGDQMFLQTPGKNWLNPDQQDRLRRRFDIGTSADDGPTAPGEEDDDSKPRPAYATRRVLIGQIIVEFGFDATDETDLQDFAGCYEDYLLLVLRTTGIRYRGTYAVYSSSENRAGKYRTVWSFRGPQALDKMTTASDPDPALGVGELGAITKRLRALADNRPGAGRSQNWYQPAWGFRR
jgi:hypothetical protein